MSLSQDDWDSDFDDDSSPGGAAPSHANNFGSSAGAQGGQALSVPAASSYQARGSTGDISSIGRHIII